MSFLNLIAEVWLRFDLERKSRSDLRNGVALLLNQKARCGSCAALPKV